MKPLCVRLAFVLIVVLLIPVFVNAQMPIKQPLFRIDIPFAFVAGGAHLPPGQYFVYHPGDPYLIVIERNDGRARAMEYVHPSGVDAQLSSTKLVFNKYGDQYFLSQVWTEADSEMHQCFKCRTEQGLIAKSEIPQQIVLAAK